MSDKEHPHSLGRPESAPAWARNTSPCSRFDCDQEHPYVLGEHVWELFNAPAEDDAVLCLHDNTVRVWPKTTARQRRGRVLATAHSLREHVTAEGLEGAELADFIECTGADLSREVSSAIHAALWPDP